MKYLLLSVLVSCGSGEQQKEGTWNLSFHPWNTNCVEQHSPLDLSVVHTWNLDFQDKHQSWKLEDKKITQFTGYAMNETENTLFFEIIVENQGYSIMHKVEFATDPVGGRLTIFDKTTDNSNPCAHVFDVVEIR